MVNRTIALTAIALTIVLAIAWTQPGATLRKGRPAPQMGTSSEPYEVVWVSTPNDYLACETAANALRRVHARATAPAIRLVLVGDDAGMAEGYLRGQRLDVDLTRMSRREFHQRYGRTPLPALYVAREGRVERLWTGFRGVRGATAGEQPPLLEVVNK